MSTVTLHRESLAGSWHPAPTVWSSGEAHPRRKSILVVLCLSLLIVTIDNTVLNTALPTLSRSLHAGTSSLQWIVDAYVLCFAALLVTAGALGDRFGRRRALLAGLIVFAIGSVAASFASSAGVLIADRVIMGLGAAFVMPSTLSILNAVFPAHERPAAIGAWSAVAGIGIVLGPTLGGLLLAHFWWGSVFLVNVPLVVVALIAVDRIVPETIDGSVKRLDVVGTVLVAGALVAIIDAIIEAPTRGWTSATTLAVFGAGLALMTLFVRRELRIDHPLIDLRVFASRSFSAAAGAVTVLFRAVRQSVRPDPVPSARPRLQPALGRASGLALRYCHGHRLSHLDCCGQTTRYPHRDRGWHGGDERRTLCALVPSRRHALHLGGGLCGPHGCRHGPRNGARQHHHHGQRARRPSRCGQCGQ